MTVNMRTKMSILSTQKGLEIPGSGRDLKGQKLYGNVRRNKMAEAAMDTSGSSSNDVPPELSVHVPSIKDIRAPLN
ncbi:hypothetical protein ACROYT_G007397 [Oculina patagonica]